MVAWGEGSGPIEAEAGRRPRDRIEPLLLTVHSRESNARPPVRRREPWSRLP